MGNFYTRNNIAIRVRRGKRTRSMVMEEKLDGLEAEHSISPDEVLTVSEVSSHIADRIDTDPDLRSIYVLGGVKFL